jgi:hypothetical protein
LPVRITSNPKELAMRSRPFLAAAALAGSIFLPGIASAAISPSSDADFPFALAVQRLASSEVPAAARDAASPKLILALTAEEIKKKKAAEAAAAKKKAAEEAAAAKKKAAEEAAAKKKKEAQQANQGGDDGGDDEDHTSPTYTGQGQTCPRWDNSCRR